MLEDAKRIAISESDVEEALIYIRLAKYNKQQQHVYQALFQMAVICYCRPFKRSLGKSAIAKLPNIKEYKQSLKDNDVSMLELHKEIIDLRDQLIAHSDDRYYGFEIEGDVTSKYFLYDNKIFEKIEEFEKLLGLCWTWIFHAGYIAKQKLKVQNL